MSYITDIFKSAVWGEGPLKAPEWNKWLHRNLSDNHCQECLKLDVC